MDSFDFLMLHLLSYFFIFFPLIFIDKKSLLLLFPSPQTGKESVSISVSFSSQKKKDEKKQIENPISLHALFHIKGINEKTMREYIFSSFSSSFFFLGGRENEIKKKISNSLSSSPSLLEKRKKKRKK